MGELELEGTINIASGGQDHAAARQVGFVSSTEHITTIFLAGLDKSPFPLGKM